MANAYRAVMFDLSGVLYVGDAAIPGAVDVIRQLQTCPVELRFVTNTSRKTRAQLLADLATFGFDIDPDTLFTAPIAAKAWVEQQGLRPYCLVHRNILSDFESLAQDDPNCVILGDAADDLNYENLNQAFRICLEGGKLVAIGDNRFFKAKDQLFLDAGPFVHALEYASGTKAIIMGKPSNACFEQVLSSTSATAQATLMIGDDVFGDIEGALNAGMDACLVRTGKYRENDERKLDRSHYCFDSVVEAIGELVFK